MNIEAKEIADLYNTVWSQPGSTKEVAGLCLNAIEKHGSAIHYRLQRFNSLTEMEMVWQLDFTFVAYQPGMPSVELICYIPNAPRPAATRNFRGQLSIAKIKGDLDQFGKDWTILRLFAHEYTPEQFG